MSFLHRTARFAAARPVGNGIGSATRAFTAGSVRALKESDRHNPDAAAHNEKHKQDQLQKQKEGKGHWKPELASDSEEAVTADRSEEHGSIKEMQEKTAKQAEEKHKKGTSQDTGL